MRTDLLGWASVSELSAALGSGDLSCAEVVDGFMARISALNPSAIAFIDVYEVEARARAAWLDQHGLAHPLRGIPYALKDLIDIKGHRTSAGSAVFADHIAENDAEVVTRLDRAGGVCLGKANLHEFAYGATGENQLFGTAVNAYDSSRLAGGSSSGSAAAVAWGLVPFALGTDTGGSVRSPAALSGLVGLKPTYGRLPMDGVVPYSWSLDHLGILTRSVSDCAAVFGALTDSNNSGESSGGGHTLSAWASRISSTGLRGKTIGVPREFFFDNVDQEILAATESVIDFLKREGVRVKEVATPDLRFARTVSLTIQMPEALSFHMPWLEKRPEAYGEDFRTGLALGQQLLAEHYVRAKRFMTIYRQEVDRAFETVDALITPSTPIVAPKIGTIDVSTNGVTEPVGNAMMRFTNFFNTTGHPAISVPSGIHSSGLPMGVQLVGRAFGEWELFAFAQAINVEPAFKLPRPAV